MDRRKFLRFLGLGAVSATTVVLPVPTPVPTPRIGTPLIRTSPLVAEPIYSFAADSDTGLYRTGADKIGFAHNGELKWEIEQRKETE